MKYKRRSDEKNNWERPFPGKKSILYHFYYEIVNSESYPNTYKYLAHLK